MDGIPYVQAAISSLIGNYYYAESNIAFIKDSKVLLFVFQITCLQPVFIYIKHLFANLLKKHSNFIFFCENLINFC